MNPPNDATLTFLRRSHRVLAGIAIGLGMLGLAGWLFGLERLSSPLPSLGQMKLPTAFALTMAGVSLWFWQLPRTTRRIRMARICGAIVMLIGFTCSTIYILEWSLAQNPELANRLTFGTISPTDSMALNTALSLILIGGALFLLETQTKRQILPAECLALAAAFLPLTVLVGFVYGSRPIISQLLYPFAPMTMAVHTAMALLALCIAILTARTEHGWIMRFTSTNPEGLIARRLLPSGIVAVLVLGGLFEVGKRLEYYRRKEEAALLVSSSVLVFVLLVRHSMDALAKLEARRSEAERHFRNSEEHLRMALEAARVGTWEWDFNTDKIWWSEAVDHLFGIPIGSFDGSFESFLRLVHPDDRDMVQRQIRRTLERVEDSYQVEHRIFWPDGSIRYLAVRGKTTLDNNVAALRMTGTALDITERKLLERELIEASNREQRRLGQDLHDDLGQWLTAIHLEARALSMFLRPISDTGAARAEKVVHWMGEALERTRMLARGMAPAVIETGGLSAALQDLVANTERMFHARCHFTCDEGLRISNAEAALQLYRIAQEAISNAFRHGSASEVAVCLERQENGRARLLIRDNGTGIPHPLPNSSGLGLRIMQYRAGLLGADMEIHSGNERGTEVVCRFSGNL